MITRWRIEAEADTREEVEDDIDAFTALLIDHFRATAPENEWECTDEVIQPAENSNGEARMYMRRVFRVMDRV